MRRQPWSDRISATAIAACFHVLAILFLGLVSPTLHTPSRPPELDTPEPVIEVELTRIPSPEKKVAPRRRVAAAKDAPSPTPQVLSRPPSPSTPQDSAAVIQPAPQAEAPPKPKPVPALSPPAVEAKAQALEPPKPVEPPKVQEKKKEKDKPQTELAAAPKAEASSPAPTPAPTPTPTPIPPARQAAQAAPTVPAPGFRLPPGYGRTIEAEGGGGLRGVLRATVGCAHENYAALTAEERERCAKAFVRDAAHGVRVDPVPTDKREGYDAEAAANARRRASKEGATASPVVACDGPGSNLGGGCLPEDAHAHIKPK